MVRAVGNRNDLPKLLSKNAPHPLLVCLSATHRPQGDSESHQLSPQLSSVCNNENALVVSPSVVIDLRFCLARSTSNVDSVEPSDKHRSGIIFVRPGVPGELKHPTLHRVAVLLLLLLKVLLWKAL
mmetsp:Transcript_11357/g.32710  ORF Transcript_11357/g.32710 Transcript_11357/m.32710 type:complete len:126 (+) Transcript_11357:287-664(+)